MMLDNGRYDWRGPDLAIKAFCDLDTVFFRGRLKGHVCVSWADTKEFPPGKARFGQTVCLGQGKALIQLNVHFIFIGWNCRDGRLLIQMHATVLHEMM